MERSASASQVHNALVHARSGARSHYADQHVEVAGFAMLFEDANQLFVVGKRVQTTHDGGRFRWEVVEERLLGDLGTGADVLYRHAVVAPFDDQL